MKFIAAVLTVILCAGTNNLNAHDELEQVLQRIYMQGRCPGLIGYEVKTPSKLCIKHLSYSEKWKAFNFSMKTYRESVYLKGFDDLNKTERISLIKEAMPRIAKDLGVMKHNEKIGYLGYLNFIPLSHKYDKNGQAIHDIKKIYNSLKDNSIITLTVGFKESVAGTIFACMTRDRKVFVHYDVKRSRPRNFMEQCYK